MTAAFTHLTLRSTDPARACDFYAACGARFFDAEPDGVTIVALPDAVAARGAPSHWLGTLGVEEHEALRRRWLREGGRSLGPADGPIVADPGGAVLALGAPERGLDVLGLLHCSDLEAATASYQGCGWEVGPVRTEGGPIRARSLGPRIALTESVGRTPAVPHWEFSLPVDDLDHTIARALALGAAAFGEIPEGLGLGPRRAVFDDPTGAAVAFHQAGT